MTSEEVERRKQVRRKVLSVSKSTRRNTPVLCAEIGEEFQNARAAAQYVSVPATTVYTALHYGMKAGGFHWRYAEDIFEAENWLQTYEMAGK